MRSRFYTYKQRHPLTLEVQGCGRTTDVVRVDDEGGRTWLWSKHLRDWAECDSVLTAYLQGVARHVGRDSCLTEIPAHGLPALALSPMDSMESLELLLARQGLTIKGTSLWTFSGGGGQGNTAPLRRSAVALCSDAVARAGPPEAAGASTAPSTYRVSLFYDLAAASCACTISVFNAAPPHQAAVRSRFLLVKNPFDMLFLMRLDDEDDRTWMWSKVRGDWSLINGTAAEKARYCAAARDGVSDPDITVLHDHALLAFTFLHLKRTDSLQPTDSLELQPTRS